MPYTDEQIKQLLKNLAEEVKNQKNQISDLRKQLEQKEELAKQLRRECVDIQIKYDNLVSAKSIAHDSAEAKMSQQRLSRLVRRIDRCIALLNKTEIKEQQ